MDFGLQLLSSAPSVSLSTTAANLNEASGMATIVATLSNSWGLPVTVDLSFGGTAQAGFDYNTSGAQILLLPGQTSGSITLTSLPDNLSEANESIAIDIAQVIGGSESGTQQVTVTISDDDPLPTVALSLGGGTTLAENGGQSVIVATLSAPSGQTVSVSLAFAGLAQCGGIDFSTLGTMLTIPAGQTSATLVLSSLDDTFDELQETITVTIQSATAGATAAVQPPMMLSISDDDAPTERVAVGHTVERAKRRHGASHRDALDLLWSERDGQPIAWWRSREQPDYSASSAVNHDSRRQLDRRDHARPVSATRSTKSNEAINVSLDRAGQRHARRCHFRLGHDHRR